MPIITLNGIERIGKQHYSGILNKYLKNRYGDDNQIRKFSFPSYSTKTGAKLAQLIRRYKEDDLLNSTKNSHFRYRRIAELFLENMDEYQHLVSLGKNPGHISLVNNYHYSVIAHGFAAGVKNKTIKALLRNAKLKDIPDLAFFLVTKNVKKMLTEPLKTHEIYLSREEEGQIAPETFSNDYINYYILVNNYYRQIYLANSFEHKESKFVLVEIAPDSVTHITDTVNKIKCEVESFFQDTRS